MNLIQLSDIFNDSKDFVDRPLLEPPDEVLQNLLSAYSEGGIVALQQTMLNLTSLPGSDLLKWEPPDWTPRYVCKLSSGGKATICKGALM